MRFPRTPPPPPVQALRLGLHVGYLSTGNSRGCSPTHQVPCCFPSCPVAPFYPFSFWEGFPFELTNPKKCALIFAVATRHLSLALYSFQLVLSQHAAPKPKSRASACQSLLVREMQGMRHGMLPESNPQTCVAFFLWDSL